MAAVAVTPNTMDAGEVVQWQNTEASLTDLRALIGAGNVSAPNVGGVTSIRITLNGVAKTVNHLDYVLVCTETVELVTTVVDTAVLTPVEFARYYVAT